MAKREEAMIDFRVFEDDTAFLGVTEATLPDLTFLTTEMTGAGIAGKVETPILGHLEAMTLALNFRTLEKGAISLVEPRRHSIDLRVAQQENDTSSGAIKPNDVKHKFVIVPKKLAGGKVAPASTADASGEYAVHYWSTYMNGKKTLEIDPLNYICYVNGVDYLKDVRAALGIA